jgi:hypothetical protein
MERSRMAARKHRRAGVVVTAAALASGALMTAGPPAAAEPATPTTTTATGYPADEHGYVDSAARCDDSQSLMEFGRTSRALVAICVDSDGQLEYRGVRLSDQAALTMTASRASNGGVVATNDGVTYSLTPEVFLVSEGDTVLHRETWTDFHQARFAPGASTATSSATSSAATSSATPTATSSASPTTSVSTTTVTLTPTTSSARG